MSRFSQDVRDGLAATLKARQERHDAHYRSSDASLRTPYRLERLRAHVDEAQAAFDEHVTRWGPDGTGPVAPEFGIYAVFGGEKHKLFVDGAPLTIEQISRHYNLTESA